MQHLFGDKYRYFSVRLYSIAARNIVRADTSGSQGASRFSPRGVRFGGNWATNNVEFTTWTSTSSGVSACKFKGFLGHPHSTPPSPPLSLSGDACLFRLLTVRADRLRSNAFHTSTSTAVGSLTMGAGRRCRKVSTTCLGKAEEKGNSACPACCGDFI